MTRRTTVLLDEDVYRRLVDESLKRYGTPKAVSKVLNEELQGSIRGERRVVALLRSKRIARVTAREFEEFRSQLSQTAEA